MNRTVWYAVAALLAAVLVASTLYLVRGVAVPFLLALVLAYCLDPAVRRLEERRLSRPLAVTLVFAVFFAAAGATLAFLIPAVRAEVLRMQQALPEYAQRLYQIAPQPLLEWLGLTGGEDLQTLLDRLLAWGKSLSADILRQTALFLSRAFTSTFRFLLAVLGYLIIPVYLFYLLRDFSRLRDGVVGLIPLRFREQLLLLGRQIDEALGAFIRGQLTVCLVLAVLYSFGLAVIGIDLALVIGLVSGIAFIIPYLGTLLGIVAGCLMAIVKFHDLLHPALVIGWFAVVQGLEGAVITPRLVGTRVGLHPLATILAVLVGGELAGFLGLLLAVPFAAAGAVLLRRLLECYRRSAFYGAGGEG
jgi:predicted PurR-regulated permease PerM